MSDGGWNFIATAPEGVPILTKIDDHLGARNEAVLIKDAGLWWLKDRVMYVYYTPTHWKEASNV